MSCRYKKECPSYSGWCEGPKQDFSKCVEFLITAYERTKEELKSSKKLLICKVKPDSSTCHACLATQEMFNDVDDCSKCQARKDAILLETGCNFWNGHYAIISVDGKIKTVSQDQIYNLRVGDAEEQK